MIHHKRRYRIGTKFNGEEIRTPKKLAHVLTQYSWCLCNAFQLDHLIFFNDAFSEDGAQEFAVFDVNTKRQIESLTVSWMTEEKLEETIKKMLLGGYGEGWEADFPHHPHPEGSCHHCA